MGIEKHIIKKAIVEIYVPSADNAMDLQNKTLSFFKEKICPLIEKIIERYSISGETIRIDKLELDFENFSPENSGLGELQKLEEQIEKKIINLISENRSDNFSGEILTAVKKIPKEKADEELFFHLLKTGTLPWWAKTEQPISIETLAQKIVLQPSDSFKKELTSILGVGAVRKRIAYKLSSESIEKIISLVFSASSDLLKYLNEILGFAKDDFSASENLRQILYEFILKKPSASSKAQFISDFIKEKNDFSLAEKLYTLANKSVSNEETLVYKEALADTNEYFSGNIKKIFTVKDVKMFFDKMEKSTNSTSEKEVEIDVSESVEVYEETGDYFIKNSGVIILAPYLPALFKALELWDGKAFVSDEAKERAVYLIQYLTTGNEDGFEEHEMVLNKTLCDMKITAPLLLPFTISEKEKEECQGLLHAVADNWPALKGTSGEGMRDAFFMRDGILEQQSNGWNLKIEKTTIDILLDKLPWGISIIQMPWSKEMIFVNW